MMVAHSSSDGDAIGTPLVVRDDDDSGGRGGRLIMEEVTFNGVVRSGTL